MSQVLRAYMNGVVVGELSMEDYTSLRNDALKDGLTHWRQGLFIFGALANSALKLIYAIPFFVFWGVIYLAISEPETFRQVTALAQANPGQFARKLLSPDIWGMIYIMFVGIIVATGQGRAIGFRNLFSEEINSAVRRKLGISTEGDIMLAATVATSQDGDSKLLLDLPVQLVLPYIIVCAILVVLHQPIWALAAAIVSHGLLHYLYRNGKLDGVLSRVDDLRRQWGSRSQGK